MMEQAGAEPKVAFRRKWESELLQYLRARAVAEEAAGAFLVEKFVAQARDGGVYRAARNLKKQGVPEATALLMLRAMGRVQ